MIVTFSRLRPAASRRTAALALALAGLLASCSASPPTLPPGQAIGEPITPREPLPLATIRAKPSGYFEQTLLVEATITNVCVKKGCWMQVSEDGPEAGGAAAVPDVMVRWESGCGGQYTFPRDAVGKRVLIQGSFYPKQISEADAAHLESESGGKPVAREGFELNASGVLVLSQ